MEKRWNGWRSKVKLTFWYLFPLRDDTYNGNDYWSDC
nr:MAG TPA: hypothetical protein [Caudoviricetes sp.]